MATNFLDLFKSPTGTYVPQTGDVKLDAKKLASAYNLEGDWRDQFRGTLQTDADGNYWIPQKDLSSNFKGSDLTALLAFGAPLGAMGAFGTLGGLASGAGGSGGSSFIGSGLVDGLGPAAYEGVGSIGTAGAGAGAGAGDWWSELGLNSDPTLTQSGWSTNPSISDLTQGALTDAGSTAPWTQYGSEWNKLPSSTLKTAADSLKSGSTAKSIADALGISEGAVSALGKLGAAALSYYGSDKQADALAKVSDKYAEYGAPSRTRYEASMTSGFDPETIPGYKGAVDSASKSVLAKLSATGGNPYGNPGGLIDANKQIINATALPAIHDYQALNANTGFGSTLTGTAATAATDSITADKNSLAGISSGLGALTSDSTSAEDSLSAILKKYLKGSGTSGVDLNTGKSL